MEISIDTEKVSSCGNQIIKLSNQLNDELNTLFNRIENMSSVTGEWIGTSANKYVEIIKKDKLQYYNLKDELYDCGNYLVDIACSIDSSVENSIGRLK